MANKLMPLKQLSFDEMKVIVILWCYIKLKFDVYNYYGNWSHWAKECKKWKVELKKNKLILLKTTWKMSKHLCHHCWPLWTTMLSTLIPKVLYICVIKRVGLKGIKKLHPKGST
jgi:hypothetical protein